MLWFFKVYGIPAGMYASQVWGTVYRVKAVNLVASYRRGICVP